MTALPIQTVANHELEMPVDIPADPSTQKMPPAREHPLFAILDPADFQWIIHRSRTLKLGHHELIYRQDSPAHAFYVVLQGRVRLYRLDRSGTERTLDSHGPGECFAEVMVYARPARYACYAEVIGRSRILEIPIEAYRSLLGRRPEYTENLLHHYAARSVSRFHDLEIMTVQSARARLIRYLLDQLPEEGCGTRTCVHLPLPKCLVASRLAMQPETFSRLLNELRSEGLISVDRHCLTLHDTEALRAMCK